MKVAPSLFSRSLMSLALFGLACDGAPADEKQAEVKPGPVAEVKPGPVAEVKPGPVAEVKPEVKDKSVVEVMVDPQTEAKAEVKAEPVAPAEPVAAPVASAPPVPGAPGAAYFAVGKVGIVRLDGGKFTVLADSPQSLVKGLQVGGDGKVWTAGFQDLLRLDGDGFTKVVKAGFSDLGGSLEDFAVTADGQIWAVTYKGVSHYDGKAWTTEEKATIGAGDDLLQGIEVDAAGKIWVASTHKVHVRDAGVWKDIDLGKAGRAIYFDGLALGLEGSVYALHSTALLRIAPQGDKVEKVKLGRSGFSYSKLALSTNGGLALVDIDAAVSVPVAGASRTYDKRVSKYFKAGSVHALAVDDSGRVWVTTEAGVAILGPGDAKVEWPGGSMPELTGEIRSILVVGSGPSELPGAGAVRKGGLTGKLLRDGSPLANVAVEICPSPGMIYTKTPCADGAVKFSTKSDDSGVWTVSEVPIGTYGMAVKADGKWQITFGHDMGAGMKEGQVFDTGSVNLEKK